MKYLRGGRTVYVVIRFEALVSDIVVCPARNVDKFEITLHVFCHPFQEAVELLANILLESSSLPSPHFLDLRICVSCKGDAFAPPLQRECMLIQSIGIPCVMGYWRIDAANFKPLLMSSPQTS
jgi:hypothetical protein